MQLSEKQKYEIVIRNEMGQSILTIAKAMTINKNTVCKWINKYATDKNVKRTLGPERQRKTSLEQDAIIVNELKTNEFASALDIQKSIESKGIHVSRRTVINRLHSNNYDYKLPRTRFMLTDTHKANRLQWALENQTTNWEKVIFSDESSIWKGSRGRKRWINSTTDVIERTVKYPIKRHIWGCISLSGIKSMHIFQGIMDAKKYIEILQIGLLGVYNDKLIFQQDNDPKHTSKIAKEWFVENDIKCLKWPSSSPDLNPIENLWAILKGKVSKMRTLTSIEFEQCIETEWNNIDSSIISNILKTMPIRIEKVIKSKGEAIDY